MQKALAQKNMALKTQDDGALSEEEQKLIKLYGRLPTQKKSPLAMMQKDRKYFDSGDYALSKAGKAPQNAVGTAIPNPENIPHATSPPTNHQSVSVSPTSATASSPVKESPLSEEQDGVETTAAAAAVEPEAGTAAAAVETTPTEKEPAPAATE